MSSSGIPNDLITAKAASNVLAVHVGTVYRLVRSGKLRAWKRIGGRVRVSRADVEALLVPVEVREADETPRGKSHEEEAAAKAAEELRKRGYR